MQLTKELFVIPHEDRFILYAPLKRAVAEVNADMIGLLMKVKSGEDVGNLEERLDSLKEIGIVTEGETPIKEYVPKTHYTPTAATLIPSLDCNLRCVYCYANAGEIHGKVMDIEVAKSAVDFVIKNAVINDEKLVGLVFHGGGEPFLPRNMNLVKETVNYFREQTSSRGLLSDVVATTNGCMDNPTLDWIISNFNKLNVSIDGPEDIQNKQRPLFGGEPSYPSVTRTISELESKGIEYSLRGTITKDSVNRMVEIIEFFSSISNTPQFTLEPLFECGRCKTSRAEAPSQADFIKYLILAKERAKELGKNVNYSASIVEGVYDCFCSSVDKGFFCVLPDGNVSSCLEVCRTSDPKADMFITGRYDSASKQFVFYEDRINRLRKRNVDNIPNCQDCFAKYQCAGDCPSKCYSQTGSLFDTTKNPRCDMTRGIIKDILLNKLKGGEIQ